MHLPTPQFSRLVTVLAFDLNDPSLDSMILTWDHIATRYLKRLGDHREVAGKIESIRLLAIHDSIHAVFRTGNSYLFHGFSPGNSIAAALAATAQASHDILAAAFDSPEDQAHLAHALEESLSLVANPQEAAAGVIVGAASSAAFENTFGPLSTSRQLAEATFKAGRDQLASQVVRFTDTGRAADKWRRSA